MKHFPNFTRTQAAVFKLAVIYVVAAICLLFIMTSCASVKTHHTSRHFKVDACPRWADNIKNPENEEFVEEVAFNKGISSSAVTQEQFNERYVLTTKTN